MKETHSLLSSSISSFFWQPDAGSAILSCEQKRNELSRLHGAECREGMAAAFTARSGRCSKHRALHSNNTASMQWGGGRTFMLGNACSRLPQPAAVAACRQRGRSEAGKREQPAQGRNKTTEARVFLLDVGSRHSTYTILIVQPH